MIKKLIILALVLPACVAQAMHKNQTIVFGPHFDLRSIKQTIMGAFIPGYFPPVSTFQILCTDLYGAASESGKSVQKLSPFKTECTDAAMVKSAITGLYTWTALCKLSPKAPSTHLLAASALASVASWALNAVKARSIFRHYKHVCYDSIARAWQQNINAIESKDRSQSLDQSFAIAKRGQREKELKRLAKIRKLVDEAALATVDHE